MGAVFVCAFVSVRSLPNCPPKCRIEHALVNLALTLATNWQAMAATHVQVVFVVFFVFAFVSVRSLPNCPPKCRIEHDVVNLALTAATNW